MAVTTAIVSGGIGGGIERAARIAMPGLFVIVVGIAVYAFTLEGSEGGYAYYLNFNLQNGDGAGRRRGGCGPGLLQLEPGDGCDPDLCQLPAERLEVGAGDRRDLLCRFRGGLRGGADGLPADLCAGHVGGNRRVHDGRALRRAPKGLRGNGRDRPGSLGRRSFLRSWSVRSPARCRCSKSSWRRGWTGLAGHGEKQAFWPAARSRCLGCGPAFDLAILDLADSIAINIFLLGGGLAISIFVGWVVKDPIGIAAEGSRRGPAFEGWLFVLRYLVPPALIFILWISLPETWAKLQELISG